LKKQDYAPDVIVTDKLRSYGAAKAQIGLLVHHEQGLCKNNRAENLHQPTWRREPKMQRFKSPASAQRFLSIHATVHKGIATFTGFTCQLQASRRESVSMKSTTQRSSVGRKNRLYSLNVTSP
jgi:transposase-like protein